MERGYLLDFPFKVQRLLVCTWKNQATASNGLPYLWTMGTNPLATLYYVIIPSLALLKGTPLFPEVMIHAMKKPHLSYIYVLY